MNNLAGKAVNFAKSFTGRLLLVGMLYAVATLVIPTTMSPVEAREWIYSLHVISSFLVCLFSVWITHIMTEKTMAKRKPDITICWLTTVTMVSLGWLGYMIVSLLIVVPMHALFQDQRLLVATFYPLAGTMVGTTIGIFLPKRPKLDGEG